MPIRTVRCLGCARQWDEILRQEEVPGNCIKCGSDQTALVVTYPSAPRGTFGTCRRNSAGEATQKFDFEPEQLEFDFVKKPDGSS